MNLSLPRFLPIVLGRDILVRTCTCSFCFGSAFAEVWLVGVRLACEQHERTKRPCSKVPSARSCERNRSMTPRCRGRFSYTRDEASPHAHARAAEDLPRFTDVVERFTF